MQKERKDKSFIKKPIFPGGLKAMREIISSNLHYPPSALENKIEGTVYLRYEINYKGSVVGTKILSSLGHGCDEEATRLVKLFKFDIPKGPRRLKFVFHKTIKIHFRLPKTNQESGSISHQQTEIIYSLSKNEIKPTQSDKKPGYSYTISWK